MNKTPTPEVNERIIAALHRAGRVWRAVVAQRTNGSLSYLDSREFSPGEIDQIDAWLDQLQVGRTICILPSSCVICRTTSLPDADPDQLLPALELQAETYMPGTAPAHRRAMAILHAAEGESARTGLILAWPERACGPELPVKRDVTFAPDVACVAAILNGWRSAEPLLWVDRADGSAALAISHAQGAVLRASREDAETDAEWIAGIKRMLAETALSVGHSDTYTEAMVSNTEGWLDQLGQGGAGFLMPDELASAAAKRIKGAKSDRLWWGRYGIAAGALLATLDQLEPLTGLRADQPVDTPNVLERWLARFSTRRAAALWVATALLLVGFGPLAVAAVRVGVLHLKVGDLKTFNEAQRKNEEQLVMYDELSRRTWPMAKLLADVVNCAPVGITIESIILDESDNTVDIRGQADTVHVILEMRKKLTATDIFEDVRGQHDNRDQRANGLSFVTTAKVGSEPYRRVTYKDDFARETLGVRLYGEDARTPEDKARIAAPQQNEDDTDTPQTTSNGDELPVSEGEGNRGPDGILYNEYGERIGPRQAPIDIPNGTRTSKPPKMPELLTPEAIAELPRENVQKPLLEVVNARNNKAFSEEQRAQLQEQYEMLMQRMRDTSHFPPD